MPRAWSSKRERQYQHLKNSALEDGKSAARAKELAARTVNKQRRLADRTPSYRTQGTGNPHRGLEGRTRDELYNRARQLKISGRSTMNKAELVNAIRDAS